jgi:hypothetical protein
MLSPTLGLDAGLGAHGAYDSDKNRTPDGRPPLTAAKKKGNTSPLGAVYFKDADHLAIVFGAASDPAFRRHVGGTALQSKTQAKGAVVVAALTALGGGRDADGEWVFMPDTAEFISREQMTTRVDELVAAMESAAAQHAAIDAELREQLAAEVAARETATELAQQQERLRQGELAKRWPTKAREAEEREAGQRQRAVAAEQRAAAFENDLEQAGSLLDAATARADDMQAHLTRQLEARWPAAAREAQARVVEVESELRQEKALTATAEKASMKAERVCDSMRTDLESTRSALRAAMLRKEHGPLEPDEERERQHAAREAEQTSRLVELQAISDLALEQATTLESQLHGALTSRGVLAKQLETAKTLLSQQDDLRNALRRESEKVKELGIARLDNAALRTEVATLQSAAPLLARASGLLRAEGEARLKLMQLRTSDSDAAPLLPRTREFMRAMVDESNGSFEGAASMYTLAYQVLIDRLGLSNTPQQSQRNHVAITRPNPSPNRNRNPNCTLTLTLTLTLP